MLNSSFEKNRLNTDIDSNDNTILEVNSLNDPFVSTNEFMLSSSRINSELNLKFYSNSEEERENSLHNSLVNDSNSDAMYFSHEVLLCQKLAACAIKNDWSRDSVNELLKILPDKGLKLPKDSRNLLNTLRDVKKIRNVVEILLFWETKR